MKLPLRASEWIIVAFFGYVAVISPFFPDRVNLGIRPLAALIAVYAALFAFGALDRGRRAGFVATVRDWLPLLFTFLAFREMELFLPPVFDGRLEHGWIQLDRLLLERYRIRSAIESLGVAIPLYLECCYFFVYGVAAVCVGILYARGKRAWVDAFWIINLAGTLLAYGLFPYFPSQPPRIVFAGLDNPSFVTPVRTLNLFILNHATIHAGVFPSAHVSSAFACAWAILLLIPERRRIGLLLLIYALSVSVATVYGRYHYADDVVAGFAVSLVALGVGLMLKQKKPRALLAARH